MIKRFLKRGVLQFCNKNQCVGKYKKKEFSLGYRLKVIDKNSNDCSDAITLLTIVRVVRKDIKIPAAANAANLNR